MVIGDNVDEFVDSVLLLKKKAPVFLKNGGFFFGV